MEAQVSLHAILGSATPQTMRVKGWIGKVPLTVLIDSGSTQNFLSPYIAKRAGLDIKKDVRMDVSIANGDHIPCMGRCEGVKMKPEEDFFVLNLGSCEAVLGAQWFIRLGAIMWDFANLAMSFTVGTTKYLLKGEKPKGLEMISSRHIGPTQQHHFFYFLM